MIVTVTANPSVDISYEMGNFQLENVNRCQSVRKSAGGKGLNVSRVIAQVDEQVCATGFVGGHNEIFIRNSLSAWNIKDKFISIKGETRNCIAILHENTQTEILEGGPTVTKEEKAQFLTRYNVMLKTNDIVVASGSVPANLGASFYQELIEIANKHNKKFILDTSGEALERSLVANPYLIKPNIDELSQLIGEKMISKVCVKKALIKIVDKYNIPFIVVTLGAEGAIALVKDQLYSITPPKVKAINTVGSGDATIAGFAIGLKNMETTENILKLGCVLGTLNAMERQTGYVNPLLIEEYMEKTSVEKIK